MAAPDLKKEIDRKLKELNRAYERRIPVKVGTEAVNFFKDNFREGGFRDGGLKKWKRTRRQDTAKGAEAQYGPLMSGREHLRRSISSETAPGKVIIYNNVPYAKVHNEGYSGVQYVRPHRRKRRLASNISSKNVVKVGGQNVRGFSRKMVIPKRQFMGKSKDIENIIDRIITKELERIANGNSVSRTR